MSATAATRILFFTGKGGVGKSSLACATAIRLADEGRRVLLVSTDPASNLDEILGVPLAGVPRPVPGVDRLRALNIDPEAAARAYRERVVGPYRHVLPASAVTRIEEQLSGGCTLEIAAFDEFARLLGDADATAQFDHIVFDTAPTGHTLRLLQLPGAWDTFIDTNTTGTSCLGPLAGLQAQRALYRASVQALTDPALTTIVLVSRPERSALAEADRTRGELVVLGATNLRLIINGVFTASAREDRIASALESLGRAALDAMPMPLRALPRVDVPLLAWAPLGVERLRHMFRTVTADAPSSPADAPLPAGDIPADTAVTLEALVNDLAAAHHGVVLTMGKGGVGKTTIASAIALELARRGHRVHLSTTDPAAHLSSTLDGTTPGVDVTRIDPAVETRAYSAEVMSAAAHSLDDRGRAVLEEDLRSPCTEEIAVFRAFARTVARGTDDFVVLDTAPTGHTILLLDAAEAYHRDVSRTRSELPDDVRQLLPRLRDPGFARVLLVTLPEATPVHEAAALQDDLRRAGIEPFAWIVNQSFASEAIRDPVLRERGAREQQFLDEIRERYAKRIVRIAWQPDPPVGTRHLLQLIAPECTSTAAAR